MRNNKTIVALLATLILAFSFASCEKVDPVNPEPSVPDLELGGFYFLNEGSWGANNASLDYYSFSTCSISSGVWKATNPTVSESLGDLGNDIVTNDNYVIMVINSSNIIEIIDRDFKHVASVEVPNCRKAVVIDDYAYVTSYASYSEGGSEGFVAKISLNDFTVTAKCKVGNQPEGIFESDGKLYVANTDSYNYLTATNSTCSIIDPNTMTVTATKEFGGVNPYGAFKDLGNGSAFVAFSGNYSTIPATCSIIDLSTFSHIKDFDFSGTYADLVDGKLYIMGTAFSYSTFEWDFNNYIYDVSTGSLNKMPIPDEAFDSYGAPTGIWVNPVNNDIYIADQGNYTSPAYLYHYDASGREIEKLNVGVCPGHLAWDWR